MIEDFLYKNWNNLIGGHRPKLMSVSLISSCPEVFGNIVCLVFVEKNQAPSYIIKVCRSNKYSDKLEREFWCLQVCRSIDSIQQLIPVPHYIGKVNGLTFFIQSALPGCSLRQYMFSSKINTSVIHILYQAIDLLAVINIKEIEPYHTSEPVNQYSPEYFRLYRRSLEDGGISKGNIETYLECYELLKNKEQIYFSHGDYWQNNILIDKKTQLITGVIDWEFSRDHSLIPIDIIWFLINLSNILYRKEKSEYADLFESFKWAFFTEGDHVCLIEGLYNRYVNKFEGNFHLGFIDFLELTLAELSIRELAAYGEHYEFDNTCMKMLKYTVKNRTSIINCNIVGSEE